MADFQIAPTTQACLPQVLEQARATFDEHRARNPRAFPHATLLKLEKRHRDAVDLAGDAPVSFTALIDNVPRGFVLLRPLRDAGMIYDIGVFPKFRQQGIAQALLEHAHTTAKERAWKMLVAAVWDGNVASHRLFQSAGYDMQPKRFGMLAGFFPKSRSAMYLRKFEP